MKCVFLKLMPWMELQALPAICPVVILKAKKELVSWHILTVHA
jgi:uncharacterized cysteine cluster protein YcgN (CxxCxxCC family)